MSRNLTSDQKQQFADAYRIPRAMLEAFVEVESNGHGFHPQTGKIIIQFEPNWFRKYKGVWVPNGVEAQAREWLAFNKAFRISPEAAMLSTSIGLMQVMGFNYRLCGFLTIHQMWDTCKVNEAEQLRAGLNFIKSKKPLYALLQKSNPSKEDFHKMAFFYNGSKYQELAKKLGREPYNITLEKAHLKFKRIYP